MNYPIPLISFASDCLIGHFVRREKRFLVEFTHNGQNLWAHTNNSGSMLGLVRPGLPVLVSPARGEGRKLAYTLEMVNTFPLDSAENPCNSGWVGVNTLTPNRLLRAAFTAGLLPFTKGYSQLKTEAAVGKSRMDGLFTGPDVPPLWVECKNVTLVEDDVAAFPDAVTLRGQKHLREMMDIASSGQRAAFFYCIQRADARCFGPADYVDPEYARLFYEALQAGVEVYPFVVTATPKGIFLAEPLPVVPLPELA